MVKPTQTGSLRSIPSVDRLLRSDEALALRDSLGVERVTAIVRRVIEQIRGEVQLSQARDLPGDELGRELFDRAIALLRQESERESLGAVRGLINATGVILHTNLGRAPLSDAARSAVAAAAGYCSLEYDVTTGERGRRGEHVERLLSQLTGAENALVVNNCAAAALLVLTVLAKGGETIVSRGELVEIGGDFRVPEVMANSGTQMIEVGSTNRTRLDDYRKAITSNTRLIMRVHPSNFRIVGFTTSPTLNELAACAHDADLLLYEDAGSGVLFDLSEYGLQDEPVIKECISQGADVISFSGDKLLGSAQAGVVVGRKEIIQKLRKHPLYRALRADKLCLAALEATLEAHLRGASFSEVPALRMLATTSSEIRERAEKLISRLDLDRTLRVELVNGESAIGGGCGPETHPETVLIALHHETLSADALESRLRLNEPPVIARVANDKVLLDLRTVEVEDEPHLISALQRLAKP
jgi:L-seryl-tRNA(Ser) seleniumtransferase